MPARSTTTPATKRPGAKVSAERTFLAVWNRYGLKGADLEREYKWHPTRRWRFDIAFPSQKLAIELDGRGRHQTVAGTEADLEKLNCAIEHGWRVLRFQVCRIANVVDWVHQVNRVLAGVIDE